MTDPIDTELVGPFPIWYLDETSLDLIRKLEEIAKNFGLHIALGGGVLHKGSSEKDLDIFVYPRFTKKGSDYTRSHLMFEGALTAMGFKDWAPCKFYKDDKKVRKAIFEGKRVDFFYVQ